MAKSSPNLVFILPLLLLPVLILISSSSRFTPNSKLNQNSPTPEEEEEGEETIIRMAATTENEKEIHGVKIEKTPPQSKLDQLAVSSWPKWSCEPSKFPWTFKTQETMYLLEGKVIVNVEGHEGSFEIGAGDFVVFPKGMNITWDVLQSVTKHYHLEQ